MKADDAKELRELRKENQRLKKIVADQAFGNCVTVDTLDRAVQDRCKRLSGRRESWSDAWMRRGEEEPPSWSWAHAISSFTHPPSLSPCCLIRAVRGVGDRGIPGSRDNTGTSRG